MKHEFERIAEIARRLARARADVTVPLGDDAAVLAPSVAAQVVTVDVAVEGIHFRRGFASWEEIGRRAFVAAASDLAAMGARARAALSSLILPRDLSDEDLFAIVDGIAAGADEIGAVVAGGNLSAGSEVSITTTVIGEAAPDRVLTRGGAKPGDGVYVSGTIGGAALGLALIDAGRGNDDDPITRFYVEKWRRPVAAIVLGQRLVGHATAAIDVSDGVLQDLEHLAAASRVAIDVYADELPLGRDFAKTAQRVGRDPLELALTGGEDYELLFTAPADMSVKLLGTRIGQVSEGSGVRVRDRAGKELPITHKGWQHF